MSQLNAFTVDVEDYYHVSGFEHHVSRRSWHAYKSRVVPNTHRMLDLLEEHGVRATFFVLGWVAERFPRLVREIRDAGHEVGSHSYWHRLIYRLTPEEFREDLVRSRDVLQDILGEAVTAFRAPSFSITKHSLWALDILVEEGFRYDSSIFPVYHDRYGIPGARPDLHEIATEAGPLWEFPTSVLQFGKLNIPVSGGGYFRLYPVKWTLRCLARINRTWRRPFVFYVHPWEIDPGQPRLGIGSLKTRFRHYVNLSSTESKLRLLLGRFRFARLCDVVGHHRGCGDSNLERRVEKNEREVQRL
ncbi:MAG: XrtA system polysaccharide deacetylase [Pirellulales bacterium]